MIGYKIIKNNRVGYGYNDSNLKCTHCGGVTTRYIKIGYEILCSNCLGSFIQEMRKSLLEDTINGRI